MIIISSIIVLISESLASAVAHSQDHLRSTSQHFMLDQAGSPAHPPPHPPPPPPPPSRIPSSSTAQLHSDILAGKLQGEIFYSYVPLSLPPCQIEILLIVVIFLGNPGPMALWGLRTSHLSRDESGFVKFPRTLQIDRDVFVGLARSHGRT